MRRTTTRRGGFTLVELIVVVGIVLLLTALAVGVAYSGILDNHKLHAGTDRINGWLLQQRGKAARDQAPRGVRFIIGADGATVTEAQFIEVPDPLTPNPNGRSDGYRLVFLYHQPASPLTAPITREVHVVTGNPALFPLTGISNEVSVGDILNLPELNTLHRVTGVATVNTLRQLTNPNLPWNAMSNPYVPVPSVRIGVANPNLLPGPAELANTPNVPGPLPPRAYDPTDREFVPNFSTTTFGFLRQARPTLGEPALQLSAGTVIDISDPTSVFLPTTIHDTAYLPDGPDANTFPDLNPNGFMDVLFAPNGEVLNATQGKIVLWVRNPAFPHPRTSGDARTNYEQAGDMSLIAVYTKTGAISTQPVKLPAVGTFAVGETPHDYTKDGVNNGL